MKLIMLLMLGSLVWSVMSEQIYHCKHHKNKYKRFKHYFLVLQQPQGLKALHPSCKIPNNAPTWNIHGLWPSNNDQKDSPICCGSANFDINQLSDSLVQEMNSYWISFMSKNNTDFWGHEWCKHGTCAKDFDNEQEYFQQAINLYQRYSVTKILQEQGIIPSDVTVYETAKIHEAIKNAIGASPRLRCGFPKGKFEADHEVLFSIYICFDKLMNPVDCPPRPSNKKKDICPDKLQYGAHK